jgi:hypothetical protein
MAMEYIIQQQQFTACQFFIHKIIVTDKRIYEAEETTAVMKRRKS